MKQVMTEDELATELNVTVPTIRRWRAERGLPFIRVSRNVVRFNRDSVLAWLDGQEERIA